MEALHINWFPGHMKKAIDEIKNKIKAFDLIVQVVDARAPLSTMNPVVQDLIQKHNLNVVIIVNKIDLADPVITKRWIQYLENHIGKCFPINSKLPFKKEIFWNLINNLLNKKIQTLKNKGIVKPILKMMVVGAPNVGKSTFINTILHHRKAGIGNVPGFTKGQQFFKISDYWLMMDTPGILWPKIVSHENQLNLVLANAINTNVLPLEAVTSQALLKIVRLCNKYTEHYYDFVWDPEEEPLKELNRLLNKKFPHVAANQACKNILFKISNQSHFRLSWETPAL